MTISEKVTSDLLKRITNMNLVECRRMSENMPPNKEGIDKAITDMIQNRIAELKREEIIDCE